MSISSSMEKEGQYHQYPNAQGSGVSSPAQSPQEPPNSAVAATPWYHQQSSSSHGHNKHKHKHGKHRHSRHGNSVGEKRGNGKTGGGGGGVWYRECQKNHAASLGGHAVDGCGEFTPSGREGTLEALLCAACSCHRNFHRRELLGPDGEPICTCGSSLTASSDPRAQNQAPVSVVPYMSSQPPLRPMSPVVRDTKGHQILSSAAQLVMPLTRFEDENEGNEGGEEEEEEEEEKEAEEKDDDNGGDGDRDADDDDDDDDDEPPQHPYPRFMPRSSVAGSGSTKKRFRTKFTAEQKERMRQFADSLGWRLSKHDEDSVLEFCNDIGLQKNVFKVWMHNNKHLSMRMIGSGPEHGAQRNGESPDYSL